MQSRIMLDENLVRQAQQITGIKAKSEAVQEALRALLSLREDSTAGNAQPQPEVVESLERSLKENAELWSELAKN